MRERTHTLAPSRERLVEAAKTLFFERGYEATSTMSICRLAGTSESQLSKHFGGKQGILQAIFEYAWQQINPAVRLATESIASPREKLRVTIDMVLNFLAKDLRLRTLFLLEGRRARGDGKLVVLVLGFLEFVNMVDEIMQQIVEEGTIAGHLHPQALRSALMGAIEGMLRDQMLAATSHFPASYSDSDVRSILSTFLAASLSK
jgi:TetR/AcrR family transcriptional regulator, cholesterol catabolism regulator